MENGNGPIDGSVRSVGISVSDGLRPQSRAVRAAFSAGVTTALSEGLSYGQWGGLAVAYSTHTRLPWLMTKVITTQYCCTPPLPLPPLPLLLDN
jgi:hypothetical protein